LIPSSVQQAFELAVSNISYTLADDVIFAAGLYDPKVVQLPRTDTRDFVWEAIITGPSFRSRM
jgi:hypothetical protein